MKTNLNPPAHWHSMSILANAIQLLLLTPPRAAADLVLVGFW
jgi:hypothetical protein